MGGQAVTPASFSPPTSDGTYYLSARAWNDSVTGTYQITVEPYSSNISEGSLDELAAFLTDGYWSSVGGSRHVFDTSSSNEITVNITALDARGQFLARGGHGSLDRRGRHHVP